MTCGSCVDKLARRLVANHRIDLIYAYELAEKGIERYEANNHLTVDPVAHPTKEELEKSGDPTTQYTQNCTGSGCGCSGTSAPCSCGSCSSSCPAAKANSTLTKNNCGACSCENSTCAYHAPSKICSGVCTASPSGSCTYTCSSGYEWNGSACVPIPSKNPSRLKIAGVMIHTAIVKLRMVVKKFE